MSHDPIFKLSNLSGHPGPETRQRVQFLLCLLTMIHYNFVFLTFSQMINLSAIDKMRYFAHATQARAQQEAERAARLESARLKKIQQLAARKPAIRRTLFGKTHNTVDTARCGPLIRIVRPAPYVLTMGQLIFNLTQIMRRKLFGNCTVFSAFENKHNYAVRMLEHYAYAAADVEETNHKMLAVVILYSVYINVDSCSAQSYLSMYYPNRDQNRMMHLLHDATCFATTLTDSNVHEFVYEYVFYYLGQKKAQVEEVRARRFAQQLQAQHAAAAVRVAEEQQAYDAELNSRWSPNGIDMVPFSPSAVSPVSPASPSPPQALYPRRSARLQQKKNSSKAVDKPQTSAAAPHPTPKRKCKSNTRPRTPPTRQSRRQRGLQPV